jgi:hypothetical protein
MLLIVAASPGSGDPAMTIVPLLLCAVQLKIRSAHGARFSVNPATINISPLTRALRERGFEV